MSGDQVPPRLAELVAWLRVGRDLIARDHNRRWLAKRAKVSASTLAAAFAGHTVPTWEVTEAIAAVCGLDADSTATYWRAARAEHEGHAPPDPANARNPGEFARELRALLLHRAGLTGIRDIADAADLSRSTAGRALKGDVPPAPAQLEALLRPCELSADEHRRWLDARTRLAGPPLARPLVVAEPDPGARSELVLHLNAVPASLDVAALTEQVYRDLMELGRGRGLERPDITITSTMRQVCDVSPRLTPNGQREQLAARLTAAAATLSHDEVWLVVAALNLARDAIPTDLKPSNWTNATDLMYLGSDLQWDARLQRRNTERAQRALADALVTGYLRSRYAAEGRDDAPPTRANTP